MSKAMKSYWSNPISDFNINEHDELTAESLKLDDPVLDFVQDLVRQGVELPDLDKDGNIPLSKYPAWIQELQASLNESPLAREELRRAFNDFAESLTEAEVRANPVDDKKLLFNFKESEDSVSITIMQILDDSESIVISEVEVHYSNITSPKVEMKNEAFHRAGIPVVLMGLMESLSGTFAFVHGELVEKGIIRK